MRYLNWLACAATVLTGLSALAAELQVWALPESYKVDKFGKKIWVLDNSQNLAALKQKNDIWDAAQSAITIAGARGEVVAFQLGIEGGENGLGDVNVALTDLAGPEGKKLEAALAQLFKMYYTQVKDKGSGPTNRPPMGQGWYPDALVPWFIGDVGGYDGPPFAIKPGEIQGVWIDFAIPYGIPAGSYTGKLKVTAKDGAARELTLTVKVYDFDLPRKIHNIFFINFNNADLLQAGGYWLSGAKAEAYKEEVFKIARKHRFTAGNMYDGSKPVIKESAEQGLISVDWAGYDTLFDKALNPQKNLFGPGEDAIEIWKAPLFALLPGQWPANPKAWDQMIVEIKKHWKEKGWDLSRAYVYLADEPGKEQAERLNNYAKRVKESPGENLRRQIAVYTILSKNWNGQKWVFDLWQNNLDMWMVAGDFYHVGNMNAMPKGNFKGMYQGAEPFQGNETLDADGVAMRTWSWIAWMYKLDYQCYYSGSEGYYGHDLATNKRIKQENCEIWDQPRNRPWAISQGVFIYPGKKVNYDLPIVNIRMKQVRRGQTDYEYFWLLKQAGEGELADSLAKRVIKAALSDSAEAPEIYAYGKWSHNPMDWDKAIREAAAKLESVKAKLPKEPASKTE